MHNAKKIAREIVIYIGAAAFVVDASVRVAEYTDATAMVVKTDAIAEEELRKVLDEVARRAYRAGYIDGLQATDE